MRRYRRAVVIAGALALTVLMAVDGAEAKKKKKKKNMLARPSTVEGLSGPLTLSNVNERWRGASAQTRVNLPIKKGSDREGWSRSEWLRAEGEAIKMRFSVNSREALREVLPQKNLLAGVSLICDGWSVQNPKKGFGIQVDFRFENYPARARAEFNTDLEHLGAVERFLRFNVMAVTRADERLTPVASTPATSARPATPAAAEAPGASSTRSSSAPSGPMLDIVHAEVRPGIVAAGGEVELVIEYEVSGGGSGAVEVTENRTVSKGVNTVATFSSDVERLPGAYTASQSIRIPDDAAAGYYSYKAEVSFGALSDEFTALFEVQ